MCCTFPRRCSELGNRVTAAFKKQVPRQSLAEGPKIIIGGTTLISRHTPAHFGSLTPDTLRFAAELRAGFPQVLLKPLAAFRLSLGRFPCVLLRIIADTYAQDDTFFRGKCQAPKKTAASPCRGTSSGNRPAQAENAFFACAFDEKCAMLYDKHGKACGGEYRGETAGGIVR